MLRQSRSQATHGNPSVTELARPDGGGNVDWVAAALADIGEAAGTAADTTLVALLGGCDALAFRLRVAQSHLRDDMLPSYWSESILIARGKADVTRARAIHVPLMQPENADYPTRRNGVVRRPLTDFDDPARWPNIALFALPVAEDKLLARVEAFSKSRSTLDALEHALRWLSFAWGVARTPNPLHDNYGLPSACLLETTFAAEGIDLTPGLESRASCPEAIWVSARYWQDYFEQFHHRPLVGRWTTPHRYPIDEGKPSAARKPRR